MPHECNQASNPVQHSPHVAEEAGEVVAAGFGSEDVVITGVLEKLAVQFADETTGLARGLLAPFDAAGAIGHRQLILRAGDADI